MKPQPTIALTLFAAALLTLIGVRFLLVPDSAARTFGLAAPLNHELHQIIGLRDLWLAVLAAALALLREWRALALWFGLGAFVCFADAIVVADASGKDWAIAFHGGSGVFCGVLAGLTWRLGRPVERNRA